jgi:hypothetical protein
MILESRLIEDWISQVIVAVKHDLAICCLLVDWSPGRIFPSTLAKMR